MIIVQTTVEYYVGPQQEIIRKYVDCDTREEAEGVAEEIARAIRQIGMLDDGAGNFWTYIPTTAIGRVTFRFLEDRPEEDNED